MRVKLILCFISVDQLKPGGRMVIPVGSGFGQTLDQIDKVGWRRYMDYKIIVFLPTLNFLNPFLRFLRSTGTGTLFLLPFYGSSALKFLSYFC